MPSRLQIARKDIVRAFDKVGVRFLRKRDISAIVFANWSDWRLAEGTTINEVVDFLASLKPKPPLRVAELRFPSRSETRYVWGDASPLEILSNIKPKAYFSHFSAMFLHGLTDQIPKTVYINEEQTPKPVPRGGLSQQSIDTAFRNKQRETRNEAAFDSLTVRLLSGKHTRDCGVTTVAAPDGAQVRATDVDRTLIDIAVRPNYSGGIHEVLQAYRRAAPVVSANRLSSYLSQIDHVYPYRQAIGFLMARSGAYKDAQLRLFRKPPFEFDFYLCHGMRERDYDPTWRLFFPKGL